MPSWLPADMESSPMAESQGPEQTCIYAYVDISMGFGCSTLREELDNSQLVM